jgi:tetratricopeptide (TPR) repeat protein
VQKRSLTLCLLVRNHEASVGRAIKSALAVVDEVVVVDTGSTDNTRLIVEGYGARVVDFTWRDDFAAARNAGLSAAYGDWVLVLDADEVLEPVRPVEVARLLANEMALGYFVRLRREGADGRALIQDRIRLFRNLPEARFRYPVHEDVLPSLQLSAGRGEARLLPAGLAIAHATEREGERQEKRTRNLRIVRKALGEHPEEPYLHYRLGGELAVELEDEILPVKGFGQSLAALQTAVDLVRRMPPRAAADLRWGADLFGRFGSALLAAGRAEDALAAVEEGLDRYGDGTRLRFTHGVALLRAAGTSGDAERQRTRAAQRLRGLLGAPGRLELSPVSPHHFDLYPMRHLALVALAEGKLEEARRTLMQALEHDRTSALTWCGLARAAELSGQTRGALQLCLKALKIEPNAVDAWLEGVAVLEALGFRDNAASWLQKATSLFPEHPALPERLRALEAQGSELVSLT